MKNREHPWETIYQRRGRVFNDPIPGFAEVLDQFARGGCSRLLDLGCGNGRHLVELARQGYQADGLDISQTGLRLTRAWLAEAGLEAGLVCGDARRALPCCTAGYDGLISIQVIHHAVLAEVRAAIAEIWRILRPGGIAFVTVAARLDPDMAHEEIEPGTFVPLEGEERGLPHHIFTEEGIRRAFGAFHIQEIRRRANGKVLTLWLRKP